MSDDDLPPLDAMDVEHGAWVEMVHRIADAAGIPHDQINDATWNGAIDQIHFWGETLHRLRLADPQYDETAYTYAERAAREGR